MRSSMPELAVFLHRCNLGNLMMSFMTVHYHQIARLWVILLHQSRRCSLLCWGHWWYRLEWCCCASAVAESANLLMSAWSIDHEALHATYCWKIQGRWSSWDLSRDSWPRAVFNHTKTNGVACRKSFDLACSTVMVVVMQTRLIKSKHCQSWPVITYRIICFLTKLQGNTCPLTLPVRDMTV